MKVKLTPRHWPPEEDCRPVGKKCCGRNYNGQRCCTPEDPCDEGQGDCDGPGDGGPHDGNAGCKGNLVCGRNNCKKFGPHFHMRDDCCEKPSNIPDPNPKTNNITPPTGQRCKGRNYPGGNKGIRCCTPENPCDEGEGDCDGAGDGGLNDGDRGCKGNLVCGSNNCKKFGAYYHVSDDCCEKPSN